MNRKSHPFLVAGILLAFVFISSCFSGNSSIFIDTRDGQTYTTDARDGKTYRIVKIGEQTWMAENLNYATKNSRCYDNNPENCDKYGRLYNWKEAKGACPRGWLLPKNDEWKKLTDFAGDEFIAGKKLKAKSGWKENGNGTDEYGFAALPGGLCYSSGNCRDADSQGHWWTATQYKRYFPPATIKRAIYYDGERVSALDSDKTSFSSVRCIKK